jgi:hypothetical protein
MFDSSGSRTGLLPRAIRQNKRNGIVDFFHENLNQPISSALLHAKFGSATRTRISEINRSPEFSITIHNQMQLCADGEISIYIAVPRELQPFLAPRKESTNVLAETLFGELTPERYPD